jgi:ribonuclease HIII
LTAEVFKIDPNELPKLKELLLQKPSTKLLPSTNPYEDFRIRFYDGLIVGYTSGKIVTNTSATTQLICEAIQKVVVRDREYSVIIGSDEAGKGEWLGPMTIAAVALTPEHIVILISRGVMDSKLLGPQRILELVDVIKAHSLSLRVVTITPERFNKLFSEVKDEGKTLNDMLAWGHAKAIEGVFNDLSVKKLSGKVKVVIDEFDKLRTEERLRRVLDLKEVTLVQKSEAEEETAVAAASIVARAAWEIWVDKETKRLSVDLRNLIASDARTHPKAIYFAKESYLRSNSQNHRSGA